MFCSKIILIILLESNQLHILMENESYLQEKLYIMNHMGDAGLCGNL